MFRLLILIECKWSLAYHNPVSATAHSSCSIFVFKRITYCGNHYSTCIQSSFYNHVKCILLYDSQPVSSWHRYLLTGWQVSYTTFSNSHDTVPSAYIRHSMHDYSPHFYFHFPPLYMPDKRTKPSTLVSYHIPPPQALALNNCFKFTLLLPTSPPPQFRVCENQYYCINLCSYSIHFILIPIGSSFRN